VESITRIEIAQHYTSRLDSYFTTALYKSFTYLLIYLLTLHTHCRASLTVMRNTTQYTLALLQGHPAVGCGERFAAHVVHSVCVLSCQRRSSQVEGGDDSGGEATGAVQRSPRLHRLARPNVVNAVHETSTEIC